MSSPGIFHFSQGVHDYFQTDYASIKYSEHQVTSLLDLDVRSPVRCLYIQASKVQSHIFIDPSFCCVSMMLQDYSEDFIFHFDIGHGV